MSRNARNDPILFSIRGKSTGVYLVLGRVLLVCDSVGIMNASDGAMDRRINGEKEESVRRILQGYTLEIEMHGNHIALKHQARCMRQRPYGEGRSDDKEEAVGGSEGPLLVPNGYAGPGKEVAHTSVALFR